MKADKIFFFDIDGTLAIQGETTPGNREALCGLKEAGYPTFICTGRPPFYAKELYGDLVEGIVCCNGRAVVYRDQLIYSMPLGKEQMDHIISRFQALKLGYLFYSTDRVLIVDAPERINRYMASCYGAERITGVREEIPYYSMDIFYNSEEHWKQAQEDLKDLLILNDHAGKGSADCSTFDFDKGTAVKFVLEHFGIDRDHAYAFGDGSNDVVMMKAVGRGIAMGNGVEEVKQAAWKVTDTIENEGILKALRAEGIL